jgi:ribosomal protein S18 acetylase RimI-like enzyme
MFIASSLSANATGPSGFGLPQMGLKYRVAMSTDAVIEQVTTVTDALVVAYEHLLPQLSATAAVDRDSLAAIVASPTTLVLVAKDGQQIIGMCTLATFRIPSGVRSWIEDVVVDDQARGRGIGGALVDEAVRLAALAGARSVDLTSRPEREAANRLYLRLGFERRETNVYRRVVDTPAS